MFKLLSPSIKLENGNEWSKFVAELERVFTNPVNSDGHQLHFRWRIVVKLRGSVLLSFFPLPVPSKQLPSLLCFALLFFAGQSGQLPSIILSLSTPAWGGGAFIRIIIVTIIIVIIIIIVIVIVILTGIIATISWINLQQVLTAPFLG